MNRTLLSQYHYWFNFRPELLSLKMVILIVLLGFIALVGFIYLYKLNKKSSSYKKIFIKLENFCLTNWIVLFTMAFLYKNGVAVLSARFWMVLWLLIDVWWVIYIYRHFKQLVVKVELAKKTNINDKYIPKKAS